jgi:hypothetical protein
MLLVLLLLLVLEEEKKGAIFIFFFLLSIGDTTTLDSRVVNIARVIGYIYMTTLSLSLDCNSPRNIILLSRFFVSRLPAYLN